MTAQLDSRKYTEREYGHACPGNLVPPQSSATEPVWSKGVPSGAQAQFLDPKDIVESYCVHLLCTAGGFGPGSPPFMCRDGLSGS